MRSVAFPRVWIGVASGIAAVAGVTLLGFVVLRPVDEAASQAAQDEIDARRKMVQAEIDELGPVHPWAGVYGWSDGRGAVTVALAPRSGFASFESGCSDFGTNVGAATEREGVIELAPRFAQADVFDRAPRRVSSSFAGPLGATSFRSSVSTTS